MTKGINNIEKICSFYVSDWHLIVMLLPYIKKEVENNREIITFLEENLEENIDILLSKLSFGERINAKIKSINWTNNKVIKYTEVEKSLKDNKEITILVSGKKEYIENINLSIEKYIKNNKNSNFKVINCYEVTGFNKNMKDVIQKHNKILSTAGEKKIEEVFENYSTEKASNE